MTWIQRLKVLVTRLIIRFRNLFRAKGRKIHLLEGHVVGDDIGAGGRLRLPGGVRVDMVHAPSDTLVSSWRVQPEGLEVFRGDHVEVPGTDAKFWVLDWYVAKLPDGRLRMVDLYVDTDDPAALEGTVKVDLTL